MKNNVDLLGFDVETLGLGLRAPEAIVQISLVYENPATTSETPVFQLPNYTVLIDPGIIRYAEPYALEMNTWIIAEINKHRKGLPTIYPVVTIEQALAGMKSFIEKINTSRYKKPTLVGQNVGTFDYTFLPKEVQELFNFRVWEVGSTMATAEGPMTLPQAKRACGFNDFIHHDAYKECMDYFMILRKKVYGGNLTSYEATK